LKTIKLIALGSFVAFIISMGSLWQTGATSGGASQSFDVCMEDDDNKGNAVRFNSRTGDYQFCAGGKVTSGKGTVNRTGNTITLEHDDADRKVKVVASIDTAAKKGTAAIQTPPGKTFGTVSDSSTSDSVCGCR
jgi:hypothetical protein